MLCHLPNEPQIPGFGVILLFDSLAHPPVCAIITSPSILDKGFHPVACKASQDKNLAGAARGAQAPWSLYLTASQDGGPRETSVAQKKKNSKESSKKVPALLC